MRYKYRKVVINEEENVILASYFKRILAFFIDAVVITFIYVVVGTIIQKLGFEISKISVGSFTHIDLESEGLSGAAKFIIQGILISIPTIYFTLTIFFSNGQTFGKWILRIKILSLYHRRIGFWHCVERSLGYAASTLEFGLGFIQALWNPNRMSLHDKIAETIVIQKNKIKTK